MAYDAYPGSRYGDLYNQYPKPAPQENPVDKIGPALDTVNPRPSYQTAAGKTSVTRQQLVAPGAPGGVAGSLAPELAGLKHSSEAPVPAPAPQPAPQYSMGLNPSPAPTAPPPAATVPAYLQPLVDAIPGLAAPTGLDPNVVNQVTRANQMASNLAAEQLREKMGVNTGGLVAPGDSGLADTALGSVYRGGASQTAETLGGMAAQLPQLNLQRLLAAGNLGQMVSEDEQARERFGYGKEMDALQLLMSLYGGEQGYQQAAWSPYYAGITNVYGR